MTSSGPQTKEANTMSSGQKSAVMTKVSTLQSKVSPKLRCMFGAGERKTLSVAAHIPVLASTYTKPSCGGEYVSTLSPRPSSRMSVKPGSSAQTKCWGTPAVAAVSSNSVSVHESKE